MIFKYALAPRNLAFKVMIKPPIQIITKIITKTFPLSLLSEENAIVLLNKICLEFKIYMQRIRQKMRGPHKSQLYNSFSLDALKRGSRTCSNLFKILLKSLF